MFVGPSRLDSQVSVGTELMDRALADFGYMSCTDTPQTCSMGTSASSSWSSKGFFSINWRGTVDAFRTFLAVEVVNYSRFEPGNLPDLKAQNRRGHSLSCLAAQAGHVSNAESVRVEFSAGDDRIAPGADSMRRRI
jgi:hypothetical protein